MIDVVQENNFFKAGYFGKIPSRGDFVSKRLPREFIEPWDYWLQNSISASRTHLAEVWLDTYLTSPIWRFFLSPGICGGSSWIGTLMPSVDKVGRYFPLTLVMPLPLNANPFQFFDSTIQWFDDMERLMLSALEEEFPDLEAFDRSVSDIGRRFVEIPLSSVDNCHIKSGLTKTGRWHIPLNNADEIANSYPDLLWHLVQRRFSTYSLWWTNGSEDVEPGLSVSDGLPPVDGFSALLDGNWQSCGWEDLPKPVELFSRKTDFSDRNQGLVSSIEVMDNNSPVTQFQWTSSAVTDVGCVRTINEDAFLDSPEKGFWVVADGMGGHEAGDFASNMIIKNLSNFGEPVELEQFVDDVKAILQTVNKLLLEESISRGINTIGSTVAVLIAFGSRIAVLWAGDSRVYRNRKGLTMQVTRDHSIINENLDLIMQGKNIVDDQPNANMITRAVGAESLLELDVNYFELEDDDTFLLCSDGLNKEVSDDEISDIMNSENCIDITKNLLDLTLKRGARDNVTVIATKVIFKKK